MDEEQRKLYRMLVTSGGAAVVGRGFDGLVTVVIRSRLSVEELSYVIGELSAALEDRNGQLWRSAGLPC